MVPESWRFPQQEELHHPSAHFHDVISSKYYRNLAKHHILHMFPSFLEMSADTSMFPDTSAGLAFFNPLCPCTSLSRFTSEFAICD
jgi:hypothetical protein